jgi:hypothetical protein
MLGWGGIHVSGSNVTDVSGGLAMKSLLNPWLARDCFNTMPL